MAFKVTAEDLKKSIKCPPGMHLAKLVTVEAPYFNEKQTEVQRVDFETDKGYSVPYWFNNKMTSSIFEFVQAADKVTFTPETMQEMEIELADYVGKEVAISVSHNKSEKDGKINCQIDNFYQAGKVPF